MGWPNLSGMAEYENTLAESPWSNPNGMAESTWPNPRILWPNPNRIAAGLLWPSPTVLAESYALVAAVRNLAYHRHQLVLGAPDSSAHAWPG